MAKSFDIITARERMIARRFGGSPEAPKGKSTATGGKGTVRRKHKAVSYLSLIHI